MIANIALEKFHGPYLIIVRLVLPRKSVLLAEGPTCTSSRSMAKEVQWNATGAMQWPQVFIALTREYLNHDRTSRNNLGCQLLLPPADFIILKITPHSISKYTYCRRNSPLRTRDYYILVCPLSDLVNPIQLVKGYREWGEGLNMTVAESPCGHTAW